MSDISIINNNDYINHPNTRTEKERNTGKELKNSNEKVQDVLDEKLKNSIKKENQIASDQAISSAEEASLILADVLGKLSANTNAPKLHTQLETTRVNALINQ
jgi:hypothetical protein